MKELIFACTMGLFLSCNSKGFDGSENQESVNIKPKADSITNLDVTKQKALIDSIVLVQLSNGVSFNWNNQSCSIVEDELYSSVEAIFRKKQRSIVACMLDTAKVPAIICCVERDIVVGDMAFLLVDKVKPLPFSSVFLTQFDCYGYGCKYPHTLLDYVNNHRGEACKEVESYLMSKQ